MKIISGEFKGRRIELPKGADIRPTSDKVREALFNIIKDRVMGVRVLDLFAGTGSLGIEALSRGAAAATFIDIEKRCVDSIRKNLNDLPIGERRVDIYKNDALKSIKEGEEISVWLRVGRPSVEGRDYAILIWNKKFNFNLVGYASKWDFIRIILSKHSQS